jgi:hypothetical protein
MIANSLTLQETAWWGLRSDQKSEVLFQSINIRKHGACAAKRGLGQAGTGVGASCSLVLYRSLNILGRSKDVGFAVHKIGIFHF